MDQARINRVKLSLDSEFNSNLLSRFNYIRKRARSLDTKYPKCSKFEKHQAIMADRKFSV